MPQLLFCMINRLFLNVWQSMLPSLSHYMYIALGQRCILLLI